VYALGGILYFLLAGRAPFEADDWRRPTAHAAGEGPPALRDIVPGMPRPLESICARAMARDPGERYATAEALAEDIERYLERLSVSAHRESMVERGARLLDRNRVLAYLVLAYLAMRLLVLFVARR
jgi:serine/threonine protein kinase